MDTRKVYARWNVFFSESRVIFCERSKCRSSSKTFNTNFRTSLVQPRDKPIGGDGGSGALHLEPSSTNDSALGPESRYLQGAAEGSNYIKSLGRYHTNILLVLNSSVEDTKK